MVKGILKFRLHFSILILVLPAVSQNMIVVVHAIRLFRKQIYMRRSILYMQRIAVIVLLVFENFASNYCYQ
jgi:hypothetical protein